VTENTIQWDKDGDGIVTLTLDDPTGSANVMNEHYAESMHRAVERLVAEKDSITGVVITSAKKTFFAGGDLKGMIKLGPEDAGEAFDTVESVKRDLRALETLGKPVVAAVNGAALGGGLEIALACHHRIAADVKGLVVGLPEVTLGLLPGGGGVTRTVRMFGIQNAFMNILSQGTRFKPDKAKEMGLVDELVGSVEELLPAAKAWIKANPESHTQPWDAKGYKMPGAGRHPAVVPGAAAQAAQGRADACAAGHFGRRGRRCAGGLRHRQPHREPLLRWARHRPSRQEHDPSVLLRPAAHQRRRFAPRRHRAGQDQQDRCAWCGHDGRRHRLRVGQGRLRRRAERCRHRGGEEGQGLLGKA
jgi:enoyl-CoA hydratase/carnithine racemase